MIALLGFKRPLESYAWMSRYYRTKLPRDFKRGLRTTAQQYGGKRTFYIKEGILFTKNYF